MMPMFVRDVCLWISDIPSGPDRRMLQSLTPGSQIWIDVEGQPVLIERMKTGKDGRPTLGLKPVGPSARGWLDHYKAGGHVEVEMDWSGQLHAN